MARIVAAFGASHSTMLFSSAENWLKLFDHVDRKAPVHDFTGVPHPFEHFLANRPPDADARIAPGVLRRRHAETNAALDRLEAEIAGAGLDALIVVGDDQREIFQDDCRPAIAIHYGETIRNAAAPPGPSGDWYVDDQRKRLEDGADVHYPCDAALGVHLIEGLTAHGFDVTALRSLAADRFEGHAYSFVHRRLMRKAPVPVVPVFLNTYYPPNQPTPERCRALGEAIGEIVMTAPGNARVGLMASGGLSHFLVNEDLDARVIAALRAKDIDALAALPAEVLVGGSSEIRNWICVAAAVRHLDLDWLTYVPAYRSRALTGVGLGFAAWR